MRLFIVSGRSGSGKTIVLNILEDLGFYCIDNLPLDLLPDLMEKLRPHYEKITVSIDARNLAHSLAHFGDILKTLKNNHDTVEIIFLDADDDTLLKRFSETRRKHPLTNASTSLKEALNIEKSLLLPIIDKTDLRIDTSHLTAHKLRNLIKERITPKDTTLSLLFQSFGYKHGVPNDSDFIFDIRCLPNPYWEKNLTAKTGLDNAVINYLDEFAEVHIMYNMIKDFVEKWLPYFENENRKYLTVSIGCTGGRHRSVYMTEKLKNYFAMRRKNVNIRHRDL